MTNAMSRLYQLINMVRVVVGEETYCEMVRQFEYVQNEHAWERKRKTRTLISQCERALVDLETYNARYAEHGERLNTLYNGILSSAKGVLNEM